MASPPLLLRLLTTAILLLLSLSTSAASIQDHELQRTLTVIRSRGYSLFSNAIATSDILDDVVFSHSASTFTFFVPTDSSLFQLDMSGPASKYINTLRCHVITRRMTAVQLRHVPSGSVFESLMKGRGVKVELWRSQEGGEDVITVNGIVVDFPGLYYSRNVAVHGLGGILNMSGGRELLPPPLFVPLRREPPPSPVNLSAPQPEVTENNNSFTSRPFISSGGGGEMLPPPLSVAPQGDPPASPVNISENHTTSSPPFGGSTLADSAPPAEVSENNNAFTSPQLISSDGGKMLLPPLAAIRRRDPPTSPLNFSENHTFSLPPGSPLADAVPPAEVTENNFEFTWRRRLISGGEIGGSMAVSAEDMAGVMEMLHSDLEKWDGRIFDCLLTDGFGHVSTPRGYLYTRQQSNLSMLSCAGLHEFLHLQNF